MKKQT